MKQLNSSALLSMANSCIQIVIQNQYDRHSDYHGNTMVCSGTTVVLLLYTMVLPRYTVVVPWCAVVLLWYYYCTPWYYHGVQWYYSGTNVIKGDNTKVNSSTALT
jgi:hypothetical protein